MPDERSAGPAAPGHAPWRARCAARWSHQAWQPRPGLASRALQPLAWLYRGLAILHRVWWRSIRRPARLPVPVLVVGNLVAGGAGKTPVVIALVQALRAAGWTPGVVARGYGRAAGAAVVVATAASSANDIGDEPLLIRRRTAAPLAVGAQRAEAARQLLARHPEIDVIVSDDGLQHHALAHDAAVVVFDDRGVGNGLVLPAGPLREPLPGELPPHWLVVYSGRRGASTPLPGVHVPPSAKRVLELGAWWQGATVAAGMPLAALAGRPLLALAGIGDPSKFFATLDGAGLRYTALPMPDHARYKRLPWPAGTTDVVTTEKDAVKLPPPHLDGARVWVVPLDSALPAQFVQALLQRLAPRRPRRPDPTPPPARLPAP